MPKKINKKILIVEDDEDFSVILQKKFANEGFSIVTAGNGQEAIEVTEREKPDLILSDVLMPKMDGMTMMKKLREANEWGKSVPIILLTNLSADDDKINKAITENEPAYYLVKANYTISDLVEKIKERLSRKY